MATLKIKFGLDSFPAETKDRLIAPKISELTEPNIPDITASRIYPLNVFIMNFELSLAISNKNRQLIFNILRKGQDAFDEYCEGRENLFSYTRSDKKKVVSYFAAVRNFEHCLAHVYQTVRCMNSLANTWGGPRQFDHGDGSILERVNILHNEIKHMDVRFEQGNCPDEISFKTLAEKPGEANTKRIVAPNIPVWLTDDALECGRTRVTYEELSQEILEILEDAGNLAGIQPKRKEG